MLILGIDTSCDDTSVAVYDSDSATVLSELVSSQIELHTIYGGVVPEIAARKHLEYIVPLIEKVLDDAGVAPDPHTIDLVAATRGPGLIGGLLVGYSAAKALSLGWDVPFVGVNHINGHLISAELSGEEVEYPHIAMVVSGGHSEIYKANSPTEYVLLGETRDDAAGELLDKVGRLMDLPFPSGPIIDGWAVEYQDGTPKPKFPRPLLKKNLIEFSFSGLKTACLYYLQSDEGKAMDIKAVGAEVLMAAVDCLVGKAVLACEREGIHQLVISGGVASSEYLRQNASDECGNVGIKVVFPKRKHCTDNAAMIALAGFYRYTTYGRDSFDQDCSGSLMVE